MVRRDILEAIIRTVAEEGRTVFFSSHLLEEVERVADDIAMMFAGEVVLTGPLGEIIDNHHRLSLRFESPQSSAPKVPGVLRLTGSGREWTAICNGRRADVLAGVAGAGGKIVAEDPASLDEIVVARAGATGPGKE